MDQHSRLFIGLDVLLLRPLREYELLVGGGW